MHKIDTSHSYNHSSSQHRSAINTLVNDFGRSISSNTSLSTQHHQPQHTLPHQTQALLFNTFIPNLPGFLNFNSNITQQPMSTHPVFINNQPQQPIPLNGIYVNQQMAPSTMPNLSNINNTQQPLDHPQVYQGVVPMDGEVDSTSSSDLNSNINRADRYGVNHNQTTTEKGRVVDVRLGAGAEEISQQARRYAETRYAFPPFILTFDHDVEEKPIIDDLTKFFSSNYNVDVQFAGHRLKHKRELLLFAINRESFIILFDESKWPSTITSLNYRKVCPNHLPPQFSVVIRNMSVDIDDTDLLKDLKDDYPDVINVHRIMNKNNQPTSFVRLDIGNVKLIDELLKKKHIYINNSRFTVVEYLAPAKVLVCSKCFGIGHFRNNCKNQLDICKVCGEGVKDIVAHKETCNKTPRCIRCNGEHNANDLRCPDIKSYRSILTKSLLINTNDTALGQQANHPNYYYMNRDFPPINAQAYGVNANNVFNINKRIDELMNKINVLDDSLNKLVDLNTNYFNQFLKIKQVVLNHDHMIQLQQLDMTFQKDFLSNVVSPLCHIIVDLVPNLVKQKVINDKTALCPSLSSVCEKLINDMPQWTNRFIQNENYKVQLINEYNRNNQQYDDISTYNNNNSNDSYSYYYTSKQ
ncbi:unnamed protein product [Adineta steineri]|uniref:CCHC-type domain-containing protein n=1 Tax=Adineta steineri TaxID=433720 RepID=A0A819VUW4_9BILA|nr:unnamed protein product [Adineta steineri]CAF4114839.1 unnamed protein product [Adineta steineri]